MQVSGPARILEVVGWFTGSKSSSVEDDEIGSSHFESSNRMGNVVAGTGLVVCRVKNKFGLRAEELVGGYRDVLLSVQFVGDEGLGIIGEIQVSCAFLVC